MRIYNTKMIKKYFYFTIVIFLLLCGQLAIAQTPEPAVHTSSDNLATRVAPGELLPISIKLTNFGNQQRADVTITYRISDQAGTVILTSTDTVAVETTASFNKIIQIPQGVKPGRYTAETSILYPGQNVPASSSYQFTVERKIGGIFLSDLILYGILTLFLGILVAVLGHLIIKKRRADRFMPHEYPKIPLVNRVFYEIISDTIMQMRYQIGRKALEIAKDIDGLKIDEENGRVLEVKKKPAKIIALLISKYENILGQKVSFSFNQYDKKIKNAAATNKNLVIIRKH